ncbi:Undecaprenyl-phosphate glucose phosphotransferase [Emticicia oligotrophica DSM 17448]|uniref:Undecaprenyl-phosphate glucose phosphotransferase n=1 Tax=Emticicia oligotrophica (strain DSM 17448 / CIP 109782 / MTCC 6937 / GPTSA100-15) TaxID=929562 RepID=A0ABM5N7C7_EMTOG|nr:undecaprenyl-phosphate glucose phosphotransferase [Emticicia oligotrophica]AFK05408.1 Undecaprenyl-phosphate glucose phosphotransferase [Emticicia oligotrophica DSM 17448]
MRAVINKNRQKRLTVDIILLIASFYFAMLLVGKPLVGSQLLIPCILSFIWYFTSKYTNLYDDFRTTNFATEFVELLANISFQLVGIGFIYFTLNDNDHVRTITGLYIVFLTVLLGMKKYFIKQWKLYNWLTGHDIKNLLIVGSGEQGITFFETALKNKQFGYNPVGFVDDTFTKEKSDKYKGSLCELENVIEKHDIDELIVSLVEYNEEKIKSILRVADKFAVRVRILPEYLQLYSSKFRMDLFGNLPVITVREEPLEEFHWYALKTIFDVLVTSLIFIFVFSWLFPIIAIAIKLDSRGPVFFLQDRWGKDGKVFKCIKFRTMVHNASTKKNDGRFFQTVKNDKRITRVGAFLRKTNLDELPQFLNVFLGDMSVIGPRPHAVQHSIESKEQIENYLVRHLVKPGITGWAQVNGYRGETSNLFMMEKRVELDIWYIENWSFWLDVKVFIMTVYNMFKGDMMAY